MKSAVLEKREVEVGGASEIGEFTIAANAKAFRILIDGLYSDKPRAIVRELWSNAFDSHIEHGCADRPFECHLPTQWEPFFSVRDFGVSLSHEGVMKLYTRVFESTKEDTNKAVGKFGLGSKTFFAYTDSANVIARKDGRKRTYNAFIAENGKPMIVLFADEECDEEQGLEVSFSVKVQDIENFKRAARMTLPGFDVHPIMTGAEVVAESLQTNIEGTGWRLVRPNNLVRTAVARQGCVIYPIDRGAMADEALSYTQLELLNSPLFIDFPIGDVDITPSRETLSYDDATKKNIAKRLVEIENEIVGRVEVAISGAKTLWEARRELNSVLGEYSLPSTIRDFIKGNAKWRGETVERYIKVKSRPFAALAHIRSYELRRRKSEIRFDARSDISLTVDDGLVIVFQDVNKRVTYQNARLREFIDTLPYNSDRSVLWVKVDYTKTDYKRLLVDLGKPPANVIYKLEDMPEPYINRVAGPKIKIKRLDYSSWTEANHQPEDGGIYVDLKKNDIIRKVKRPIEQVKYEDGQPVTDPATGDWVYETVVKEVETHVGVYELKNFIELLVAQGVMKDGDQVLGITASYKNIPTKHAGWKNFFDLLDESVDTNIDLNLLASVKAYDPVKRTRAWNIAEEMLDAGLQVTDGPAKKLMAEIEFYRELVASDDVKKAEAAFKVLQAVRPQDAELPDAPEPCEAEISAFEDAYPMAMALVEASYGSISSAQLSMIVDYVILVDKRQQV